MSEPTPAGVASSDSPLHGLLASGIVVALMAFASTQLVEAERKARRSPQMPAAPLNATGLSDQYGNPTTPAHFADRTTVVAFFFTRCNQSCPVLMQAMQKLHGDLARHGIAFTSISIEGSHDTVEVLRAYAENLNADWQFLTGAVDRIRQLAREFAVSVVEAPDQPIGQHITHTNRLLVLGPDATLVFSTEAVRRVDPLSENSPFELDDAALRRIKLAALDANSRWIKPGVLPHLNCILNAGAAVLLVIGFLFIRLHLPQAHATTMLAALAVSAVFLASYLYYHYFAGDTRFTGSGSVRTIYFAILISHVILAIVSVPLILITLYRAFRRDFARHRRIARWTLGIWLYVSVTGVLVYLFLYQWFAS